MFQTKDILCSGVQMTRQGRARPRRQLIIILAARAVAQPAAAEDAEDAANAEKTPKKNDVSATITFFCSAAGAIGAEGVEQDVADVAPAAAKLVGAKHAGVAKHAPKATQNH